MAVRSLLLRGMFVGLVAAVFALAFASLFGEPQIERAITFETQEAAQRGEPPEKPLVSRAVQRTFGLVTALSVYSVAFGGLFALAFAFAYGRVGSFSPRTTAALLALGGFVTVVAVPFLKYPANPPAIGNPATIDQRTMLYVALLVLTLVTLVFAVGIGRLLAPRYGAWNATLLASAVFIILITGIQLLLPGVDEVPPGFPANVLWNFRLAALGTQAVLWTTLGLLFGALTERSLRTAASRRP
jgi:predicted cobalt transporter CbtA